MAGLGKMFGVGAVDTLLGLPKADGPEGADIVVMGADCATPYASVGAYCAGGPAAMRAGSADYATSLAHVNFDLGGPVLPDGVRAVDIGDLAVDPARPEVNRALISEAVGRVLAAGAVPVLLGGDDSLPVPMLQAFAGYGPLCILQIDAHIDWRDEVGGERFGLSSTMRRASEMAHVERIIQVGARGTGSARAQDYRDALDWGVEFVPGYEVAESGIARAAQLVPEGARVVICLDCDALDPSVMPAVIGRTAGGLTYQQALALIKAVAARAEIVGFDLVEFMPQSDVDDLGRVLAAQLLAAVIGVIARQR